MVKATVAAIILSPDESDTRILLTRRNVEPFKEKWCLPGGHIEQYETAGDAVVREVKEETGLDFDAEFFACVDEIIPEHNIHAVVLVFGGVGSGELMAQPQEVTEMTWMALDEARALPLAFVHNDILDMYAEWVEE